MTTRHRNKAMYIEEHRAFDTIGRKVNRELALAASRFTRPTRMSEMLELFQGGPEAELAFREIVLAASVEAAKGAIAAKGKAPAPFQAEVVGAAVAQSLLIASEERRRASSLIEPDFRILRLIVLACWEVEAAQPAADSNLPRSLAVDLVVAKALGLDLLDVQMTVAYAKAVFVANEAVREVWPAIHARAAEIWRAHCAAVADWPAKGNANA